MSNIKLEDLLVINNPNMVSHFSATVEVESVGFMYKAEMKIYHKKTNVTVVIKHDLFVSEMGYIEAYTEFLSDYLQDVELFCLMQLRGIRKKPLELHSENFSCACSEFLEISGVV